MNEKTLHTEVIFTGRVVGLEKVQVQLDDGSKSFREIVKHKGAIAALVQHRNGSYILVRQFRKPVDQEVLEVVAGTLDPNEDPANCARREVREETGYTVLDLTSLGPLYPTPGYSDEVIHLFYAEVDGEPGETDFDHDEYVEVEALSPEAMETAIRDGEILDGKTIALWAKVALLHSTTQ